MTKFLRRTDKLESKRNFEFLYLHAQIFKSYLIERQITVCMCVFSPENKNKKNSRQEKKNENERKHAIKKKKKREKRFNYQTELVRGKQSQTHRSEKKIKREKFEKLFN